MDLIDREVGQLPVSMGTSLAFEGILGKHPKQPKQPIDVKSIKEVWVNIRTLTRNLWNALPTDKLGVTDPRQATEVIVQEVLTLPIAVGQYGYKAKIRFYIAAADIVKWMFPKASFKQAKTPRQNAYELFERYVSIETVHRLKEEGIEVIEIANKPPKTDGTVALLTHFPHELMWKDSFSRLLLLESNTGKIKPYNLWYTKLNGISEDTPIPFTEFTLQVFGDNVLIEPQPKAIKGQLKQLALTRRWSPITRQDKLYYDITTYGSRELKEAYATLR